MSRDPYAWIDPFEEAARADRAENYAARARDEGRHDVLKHLEGERTSYLHRQIDQAVSIHAERIAEEIVMPWVRAHRADYEVYQRRLSTEIDILNSVARPLVMAIHRDVEMTISLRPTGAVREPHFTVSVETVAPIRFHLAFEARPRGYGPRGEQQQ